MHMRLFIAIQLNKAMRQLATAVQDTFHQFGVRGNFTPAENLHLTLAFIGEYGDPDAVLDAMESITFTPFTITMDKVGSFDELWWTGFEESEELETLVRKLRRAMADAGIPFDRKRFKPHVTILRKPDYSMGKRISHMSIEPAGMVVDRISLMQSTRGKNGMIYTELESVTAQ